MRRALIGCQVVLLTIAVATAARAQSYTIAGTTYYPTASTEAMSATFTAADGGVSVGTYSGFVRLVVSGSGVSCTPATNDAFYIHIWQSGCGNPNIVPQHDGWYYQLTFGTQTLVPLNVSRIATNFIYYDINAGVEVLSRPYAPAYRADHTYSFIVNTGLATAGHLHFGVSDGGFGDNSGAYQIQITQLATGFPLTVAGAGTGSGSVASQAGLTPAINCTVTAGVASGACGQVYAPETLVTLTPSPSTGSAFTEWSGACTGTGPCAVTMSQARNVTAAFNLIPYPVTVTGSGTGSGTVTSQAGLSPAITCTIAAGTPTGTCSQMYPYGTSVTLTATGATSAFTGWSGACTGTVPCVLNVVQSRAVTATFVVQPTVTAVTPNTGPTGGKTAITIAGTGFVPGATDVTIGGVTATGVSASVSSLTAITPAGALGPATVSVTTAGGTGTLASGFTYVPAPEIVSLTPAVTPPFPPDASVTFTAIATGGVAPLQYQFHLYDARTATWSVLQAYSTSNQVTWTPHTLGAYRIQVWVRSAASAASYDAWRETDQFDVALPPVTVTGLTTPATFPAAPGAGITWTATATGGVAPLQYKFFLYNVANASWTTLQDYAASNQVTWVPQAVGSYSLQVWVRGAGSTGSYDAWRAYGPFEIGTPPVTIDAVTTSIPFPVAPGASVTWTVSASGGVPPLEYQFWLYHFQGSTWEVLKTYGPDPSVTWIPTEPGTYRLQVWARSVGATALYDAWRNADDALVEDARAKLTSFTSQTPMPVGVGTSVTWTATATGGTAPLQYRFYLFSQQTASWTLLQDYSLSNQVTWTPQAAGTYWLQAWVRSAGSSAAWEDWKRYDAFSVTDNLTVTTFTSNVSPPVTSGTPVTLTATAAGGIAPVQFRFWVREPDGRWTVLRDYDAANEVIWKPTIAGSYLMQVWVRSAGSTASWEAWQALGPFDVVSAIPTVTDLTAGPLPLTAGVPLTWTATATGGVTPLQYQFWLLTMATGKWTLLQDYSTSNQAPWTPPAAGDYGLQVWVRSAGSTASYEAWRSSGIVSVR